jgi:hypothetical protein
LTVTCAREYNFSIQRSLTVTMLGKWDSYYKSWTPGVAGRYGGENSYRRAYGWLEDCEVIEDWGCGRGYFQSLCKPGQCVGLDCSCSPWADLQVDLVTYRTKVDGIHMRGVLEHNVDWRMILENALASFQKRMVLTFWTPWSEGETKLIMTDKENDTPVYSFNQGEILGILTAAGVQWKPPERLDDPESMFKMVNMIYLSKPVSP